jgi:hypothetical protein
VDTTDYALLGIAVGVVWFAVILAWTLAAGRRHG